MPKKKNPPFNKIGPFMKNISFNKIRGKKYSLHFWSQESKFAVVLGPPPLLDYNYNSVAPLFAIYSS